jgi:hypothetical protein
VNDQYGYKIIRRSVFLNHTRKGWAVDEETESDHGTFSGRRLAGPFKDKKKAIEVQNEIVAQARSKSNPTSSSAPSLPLLAAGGAASLVLLGLGGYFVYEALNPPGTTPDAATTLGDSAALATLASVAL